MRATGGSGVLSAAATARGTLSDADAVAFDQLAGALLASSSAPLGPLLRSQLPGTVGVRCSSAGAQSTGLRCTADPAVDRAVGRRRTATRPAPWPSPAGSKDPLP